MSRGPLFDKLREMVGEDTMNDSRVKDLLEDIGLSEKPVFCPSCFKVEARAQGRLNGRTAYVCACGYGFTMGIENKGRGRGATP